MEELPRAATDSVQASLDSYFAAAMHEGLRGRFQVSKRGIIHLGAHVGAEMASYILAGYDKVLYVEPHPETHRTLVANVAAAEARRRALADLLGAPFEPMFQTRCVAAGDRTGETMLHVTPRSENNTIHPGYADAILKHLGGELASSIRVPVRTLDELMENLELGWKPEDFGVLYANIEGAELMALRGAERTLASLEVVVVETSDQVVELGSSVPRTSELDAFLTTHGFGEGVNLTSEGEFVYRAYVRSR
jgi:FkbM family methyltransferase